MKGKRDKTAALLPNEIEENILSRVPVKTILRFMSVCKSWYSLFLDPYFISIHGKTTSNNLLLMHLPKDNDIVVMSSSSSKVHSLASLEGDPDMVIKRTIVGSCNGIVCLHCIRRSHNICGMFERSIYLWNPALRNIKIIKYGIDDLNKRAAREHRYVGFGFHNNDYKVLIFQHSISTQVEIYSLSSDSWRTVNIAPPCYGRRSSFYRSNGGISVGVFVNGAHHWAVELHEIYTGFSSAIISFDMGEEAFKELIVPSELTEIHPILFNYNESLAIFTSYDNTYWSCCIWVMKDYGLPQSWTKIDIPQQHGALYFRGFIQSKNEVVLSRNAYGVEKRSIVFDIDKSEVKDTSTSIANIESFQNASQVMTFRESLLLLNSTNLIHHPKVQKLS